MYSRIALTQQGPFRQLQEKRHKKKQQKHRDFETNNKNLEIELCLPGRSWKLLAKKMMINKIAPKKERFDAQKCGWFGSLGPCHFPPNPISASHEAQSFATTMLELEPCWMDRAVQVPQRILVLQEGILQGRYKKKHGNPWDLLLGGIKLATNIWVSFRDYPYISCCSVWVGNRVR